MRKTDQPFEFEGRRQASLFRLYRPGDTQARRPSATPISFRHEPRVRAVGQQLESGGSEQQEPCTKGAPTSFAGSHTPSVSTGRR